MPNPYPFELSVGGVVKESGDLTFTDSGNQPGGGSVPGAVRVLKFAFAFNDAGLAAGKTIYTPTVGDVLFDAWVEIDTAWDGTTPTIDIGTFAGTTFGIFASTTLGVGIDATRADAATLGAGQIGQTTNGGLSVSDFLLAESVTNVNDNQNLIRYWPAKVVGTNPVKVCVSQTGQTDGAAPGSTQGEGYVYLVVSTPSEP